MVRANAMMAGCCILAAACWLGLSGAGTVGAQGSMSSEVVHQLIQHDAKLIQDILAKGEPDKKGWRRVWTGAFFIAAYAQNGMKGAANAKELAAVRDTALQVFTLMKGNKTSEAAKLAANLAPGKATGGKTDSVDLQKQMEYHDIMHHFLAQSSGGFGTEQELADLAEKKKLTEAEMARLVYLGNKMALIGQLAEGYGGDYTETKAGSMKTPANWKKFAEGLQTTARAVAEAARKKDAAACLPALKKLNDSCLNCHNVFQ